MERVGKNAGDIFSMPSKKKTLDIQKEAAKENSETIEKTSSKIMGRPKELPADAVKTTLTIRNSQIVWLDRLATDVRSQTKKSIDRGEFLRAFLRAVQESGIDLSSATSEEEVFSILVERLKK